MPYVPTRNPPFETPSTSPWRSGSTKCRSAFTPLGLIVVTRHGHSSSQSQESEFAAPFLVPRPIALSQ